MSSLRFFSSKVESEQGGWLKVPVGWFPYFPRQARCQQGPEHCNDMHWNHLQIYLHPMRIFVLVHIWQYGPSYHTHFVTMIAPADLPFLEKVIPHWGFNIGFAKQSNLEAGKWGLVVWCLLASASLPAIDLLHRKQFTLITQMEQTILSISSSKLELFQ